MSDSAVSSAVPAVVKGWNLRTALFLGILLISCITLSPFPDLSGGDTFILSSGNDAAMYGVFGLLAAVAGAVVWRTDRKALACLATPPFLGFALWVAVSCVASQDVATSLKRVLITGFAAVCAMALFLLPRGRDDLARLLCTAGMVIAALCYFGIVFMPHLSVHQATDASEAQLAGDWRGLFAHKNTASGIFSILAFVGLFGLRTGRREGWILFVLSLLFVMFSGGKSSTVICFATMTISTVMTRLRRPSVWAAVALAPLALLTLLGIGSVLWPSLAPLSGILPLDATFTGRIDIWAFAIPQATSHLLFGHGIGAFWNTEVLRYGSEQNTMWAGQAEHAHNGYLDSVLQMGLPGLILMLAAFVVQPARDLRRCMERGDEPALTLMLTQIWLFSLYLSSLETFFLERANAQWVLFLFALFGARYLACFRIAA